MKRTEKKIQTIFFVIIAVILLAALGVYYFSTQNPLTEQERSIAPINITNEAEVIGEVTVTIDELLSKKNNWDISEFDTYVTYNDQIYTTVQVTSENPDIPEGLVLVKRNGTAHTIIFDTTTPDPCATLTPGEIYPFSVNEVCGSGQ